MDSYMEAVGHPPASNILCVLTALSL